MDLSSGATSTSFTDAGSNAQACTSGATSHVSKDQQQARPRQKLKRCCFEDCQESMLRGKTGPWMCKYHRNKTYKETYKKKKGKSNFSAVQQKKILDSMSRDGSSPPLASLFSSSNHSQEHISMVGQVLNEKKLTLMKSPVVQAFLQDQQKNLCNQRQETILSHEHIL